MFVKKGSISEIGLKGFNLYRCLLLNAKVPEYVIVTTKYYKRFKSGKLQIDDEFYIKLKDLFQKFNGKLIVRSSCVAEDLANKSNAGKFKTILAVDSYPKLVRALEAVWRSANGNDMAVIIQKELKPEIAGVLFTRNPVNGKDEIIIEYVEGFGGKLVSGKKDPERIIVNNKTNNEIVISLEIKKQSLRELIEISKTLSTGFGYPLDIEWAKSDGTFYILQARPITTLPVPNKNQGRTYSRVTGEQFYSGAVSPLFYSIFEIMYSNYYIKDTVETLGIDIELKDILICHKNHLYIDTALAQAIFSKLPIRIRSEEFLKVFPEDIKDELIKNNNRLNPFFIIRILNFLLRHPQYLPWNLDNYFDLKIVPNVIQNLEGLGDFKKMNKAQISLAITKLFETAKIHIQASKWGLGLYLVPFLNSLDRLLKEYNLSSDTYQKLISGLEINKTLDAAIELKKLAQLLRKNPQFYYTFKFNYQNYNDYKNNLEQIKKGEFIIDYFEYILKKYGHRRLSRDILSPSWKDEPMIPFTILKKLILEHDSILPESWNNLKEKRIKLIQKLYNRMTFKDKILLKTLLRYLNRYIAFREHQRFYLDMIISKMRELVLQIGYDMKNDVIIKDEKDIFFMKISDIFCYLSNKTDNDLIKRIEFNKMTFEAEHSAPGKYMRMGVDFDSTISNEIHQQSTIDTTMTNAKNTTNSMNVIKLHGQPVSPGWFKGRVRVADNIDEELKLEKNEILVTKSIDPGQTHEFLLAGALVLEVGGILSHGAILAREFNLPTVANVKNATKIFQNGQCISVNGTEGEIIFNIT